MSRIVFLALLVVSVAAASPVNVTYTVAGSSGNWTLDFSVMNNEMGTDQAIYLFGVLLDGPGVIGSPAAYDPTVFPTWTNSGLGGSSLVYNNVWLDPSASNLLPGQMLSGFDVLVTSATAPQAVPWFAISTGAIPYTAGGNLGDPYNPGFEGVASPEPATFLLLAVGAVAFQARHCLLRAAR
ncbi:MAG: hypothetical protein JO097_08220 [Acidobacteriaceae bacterium]|nr:hypothetical protein [Acidobacteriaceae bacterium]